MSPTRDALRAIGAGLRQLLALRWARALLALAMLLLAGRLALGWILARAIDRLASERELACRWEDLDLSLFTGRAELSYLELSPRGARPDARPLLGIEYGVFDLQLLPLLAGDIRIRRAEVDGLDLYVERDAAGRWNLERHVGAAELLALFESQPEPPGEEQEPRPLDLAPPLTIDALRLQHARLSFADRSVAPALELELEANARLSSLGIPGRPTRFSLTASGGGLFDGASLSGEARTSSDALRVSLRAQVGSFRPRPLAPYLERLDVVPACESLAGGFEAELEVSVLGEARDALRASLVLANLRASADGVEALALDRLRVEIESLSADHATLPEVELGGLRGHCSREPSRALRVAGFDLLPAREARAPTRWSAPITDAFELLRPGELPRWARLLARRDGDAYPWSLASLSVKGGLLRFVDRTVEPPADFPLEIEEVTLREVVHDPRLEARAIPVLARLHAPGLAESIRLEGSIGPFAPERSLDLVLEVDGIQPTALAGHLRSAGLEGTLERGSFRLHLGGRARTDEDGRTEGSLELDEVTLLDREELLGVRSVALRGLVLDPAVPLLRVGEVEIAGPRLALTRDPSRNLVAFGLRTLGFTAPAPGAGVLPVEAGGAEEPGIRPSLAPAPPLCIELGRLAWSDSDVQLVDRSADPPRQFALEQLGFELTNLTLGGDPAGPEPEPARFTAHAVSEGVLDELTLEGLVRSRPGEIDLSAELALRGRGLRGERLAPYLLELGIEPALSDGGLSLDLVAGLEEEEGWRASLELRDLALTDGGTPLLSLEELRLDDVRLGETLVIGEVALTRPFLRLGRDAGGVLSAAGLRLVGRPGEPAAVTAPAPAFVLPHLAPVLVHRLAVSGAHLAWSAPELATELLLELTGSELGTSGERGEFQARLGIPGALEALELTGNFTLAATRFRAGATLVAQGIRAGPFAALLPDGIELESRNGQLELEIEAALKAAAPGGFMAALALRELSWGEAGEPAWLELDEARVDLARLDPGAGVLEIGGLRLAGTRIDARRDAAGALHALGLRLSPAPAAQAGGEPIGAAPVARPGLARIGIGNPLALEIAHFRFRDETLGPRARPLEGRVALQLDGPCVLLDATAEPSPLTGYLEGSLDGLAGRWRIDAALSPFASEPRLELRLGASELRAAGLAELLPALGALAAGELEGGELEGRLEAALAVRRARPTELGLGRPFGADLLLEGLLLRDAPGGRILAGVDRIRADVERVDPGRGSVHVRTLEIQRPRGLARRDAAGLHVLGFCLGAGSPPGEAAGEPAPIAVEASASPATIAGPPAPPGSGEGELRIDEILVSGIDFELRDESAEPPLVVPLAHLEAEVRRFTTRAFTEELPIQFSAEFGPGAQTGAAPGAAPVLGRVEAAGRVAFFPAPAGWAQLTLSGLELPPFAGLAQSSGLTLDDGALDASLRLRLEGRGARVDSSLVFSDLDLREPEGGLLARLLSLPMSLDSALFLLRNQDGEHRLSLGFPVQEDGVSGGALALAATRACAEVLARALAAAPLRLLGTIVPGSNGSEAPAERAWTIPFAPGSTEPGPDSAAALEEIERLLESGRPYTALVRHELGAADLEHAARLANPEPERCLELVARLRQRKAELLRRRDELAAGARAAYAVGTDDASAATEALRGLERELAQTERSLDGVLEILRSASARQQEKRTRAACREIAELRLAASGGVLLGRLFGPDREHVELRAPRFEVLPGAAQGRVVLELRER